MQQNSLLDNINSFYSYVEKSQYLDNILTAIVYSKQYFYNAHGGSNCGYTFSLLFIFSIDSTLQASIFHYIKCHLWSKYQIRALFPSLSVDWCFVLPQKKDL